MIPGETIASGAPETCSDCQAKAELGVYQSGAGYYVGSYCNCGPYSRESGYFGTREEAEREFANGGYERSSEFVPAPFEVFSGENLDEVIAEYRKRSGDEP